MQYLTPPIEPAAIVQELVISNDYAALPSVTITGGGDGFRPERHGYRPHPRAFAGNRPGTHKRKARGQRGHAARRAKRRI